MSENKTQLDKQTQQENSSWKVQKYTQLMTKDYDFLSYDDTRDFLDRLEVLSKDESYYPDLRFTRTHVNISIGARNTELEQIDYDFSKKIDSLIND